MVGKSTTRPIMLNLLNKTHPALLLLVLSLPISSFAVGAESVELESIKAGQAALTFAAGGIRQSLSQDGIVNPITGDNQTTGNRMLLGTTDVVYLSLKNSEEASIGDLYTVYRRIRKVFHPSSRRYMGYLVNMLGVVKVTQVDHQLTTVRVVRSYAQIMPGDSVMRFSLPSHDTLTQDDTVHAQTEQVEGMILDLQSDKNMMLVGQWNVVYLDRGRQDGVKIGDRMEVYRLGSGLPRRTVGEVTVLAVEDATATALISRSTSRILVGDRFALIERGGGDAPQLKDQRTHPTDNRSGPSSLGDSRIRLQQLAGRTVINLDDLVDQLQYESGEVFIKPQGLVILEQIAAYLKTITDKHVRVEGHADNMEIGPSLKSQYPTNWELSKARAARIVRYLVEQGGLDSVNLSTAGYGDTKPVASNTTEEGRKQNRRIEIVLYSSDASEQTQKPQASATPSLSESSPVLGKSSPTSALPSGAPSADNSSSVDPTAASAGRTPVSGDSPPVIPDSGGPAGDNVPPSDQPTAPQP
ncbi:MAG: OmpA family protein [Nitrospiraceae bacterium]